MQRAVNSEEVQLLFDLLVESIEDPEAMSKYVDVVPTSEEKFVSSASLQEVLQQYEKQLEAPVFSLKSQTASDGALYGTSSSKLNIQSVEEVSESRWLLRFASALVDTVIFLGITIAIAIHLSGHALNLIDATNLVEFLLFNGPFVACWSLILAPVAILYSLSTSLLMRGSVGARIFGLKLYSIDNRRPKLQQMLIRSILIPISFILGGFIAHLVGRAPLHERISGTALLPVT